jgi:BirA family biotin operon repressor/biotin-[acetyl-CoA-carboxylase] ligase
VTDPTHLPEPTRWPGQAPSHLPEGFVLHRFERLASTNDEARRLAEAGAAAGQVVLAAEQSEGRGRHGRAWASPAGNLYASVLLRPDCSMAASGQLSLVAALALAEALDQLAPLGQPARLKWPNDVIIGGAKVAGLLLEGAARRDGRSDWVVIGSGVNLVSRPDDTPYPVTDLATAGFFVRSPEAVLFAYLARLAVWQAEWQKAGFEAARRAWLGRAFGIGEEVRLRLDREEVSGRFLDLSETGALVLQQAGRRPRRIAAGELCHLGA